MPRQGNNRRPQQASKHADGGGWTFRFFDHVRQAWRDIPIRQPTYQAARAALRRQAREERQAGAHDAPGACPGPRAGEEKGGPHA